MTNRPGSFARLWVTQLLSTLLVCAGAIALVPALSQSHEAAGISSLSNGCGMAAPASEQPALSAGALAPDAPDSTDDDDDDGDEELPGGGFVLPALPVATTCVVVGYVSHTPATVVRTVVVDAHSLRAPPQ